MKRDHVNYTLVGLVVLVAFAVLLSALAMVTSRSGASTDYHAYYGNVTGLRYGAPVFYQGYRIGQVSAVAPERTDKARANRVTLSVRRDWPIPADSIARLQSSGLLADVSIGIREGAAKRALAAGGELKGEEGADIFGAMNELAGEVSTLTRSEITPLIRTLSERVDSITGTVDKSTPELVEQSRALLQRLNTASAAVNDLLKPENRAAVADILGGDAPVVDRTARHQGRARRCPGRPRRHGAGEPSARAFSSLVDLQSVLATLSGRIDAIVHHLDAASRNVDEFSREIRKNPNRLLLAPKADKVEDEAP